MSAYGKPIRWDFASEGEPRSRQFALVGGRHDLARGLPVGCRGQIEAGPRSRNHATGGQVTPLLDQVGRDGHIYGIELITLP